MLWLKTLKDENTIESLNMTEYRMGKRSMSQLMLEVIEVIVRERNNPNAPIQIYWVGAFTYMWARQIIFHCDRRHNCRLHVTYQTFQL